MASAVDMQTEGQSVLINQAHKKEQQPEKNTGSKPGHKRKIGQIPRPRIR